MKKDEIDNVYDVKSKTKPTLLNVQMSINIDDGKNKVDKIIDEVIESERLKSGVDIVKSCVGSVVKFTVFSGTIIFIILIIAVAAGIVG